MEENKQNENENRIPRENGKPRNRKNTKGLKKLKEVRERLRIKAEYRDPVRPEADFEEPFEDDQKPGNETVAATDKKIYLRVLVNLALTLIALALIIWLLPAALRFFMPFVVAIIISMIANPFVKFLKKRLKFARKVSSAIVIVLVVVAVAAALYGIGYFLVYETFKLYDNRVEILQTIENALSDAGERLTGFYNILPAKMQAFVSGTIEDLSEGATKFIDNIKLPSVSGVGGAVGGFAEVLLGIIVCIIAAYFFTAQRDEIIGKIKKMTPPVTLEYYDLVIDNFKKAIGGYFKAQFIIMVLVFIIMFIGFEILDVPFSALVALLVAFLDFLPVFGMGAVLWPWIAVDLFAGNFMHALWLGIIYGVCQVVRQLLQPKLVGDAVELNPLATLFFMFVGYRVSGVPGMILGIPIGMLLISFYRIGAFDRIIKGIRILVNGINDFRKY
ncbi:MAG: sporulation integral membrane protein YtvI [Lachnospiraceae bacterium]|nr:sporulation integral membrane protein YtvI [Lachnospiraceae bacterium]